jgi:hypothetical protein
MGNLCIQKNSFGLINVGETFQRDMDISFIGIIGKCVVVYLDDVTVFSKNRREHVHHLRNIFDRCRRYDISLNPRKSIFVVDEGNILGFVVSKEGIMIEPERTESISKIPFPHNKKSMQSFLGKINFVHRFVPSFSETVKPLQDMIKKNVEFKWGPKEKEYFTWIREEIEKSLALLSLDFNKYFILYTFTSDIAFASCSHLEE